MKINVCFPKILHAFDLKHFVKNLLPSKEKFPYGKNCLVITLFIIHFCRAEKEKKKKKNPKDVHIQLMQSKPAHLQPLLF